MERKQPGPRAKANARELAEKRLDGALGGAVATTWDAELGLPLPLGSGPDVPTCPRGPDMRPCRNRAGQGTIHPGVGACLVHDSQKEKAAGAWMMANVIARALDISPWEALLLAVKRAAAWAAYYEARLAEVAEGDHDAFRPGGSAHEWVLAAERVNDKMARYAKMAVDAGVAAMMVQRAKTEGAQIARVLNAALGAADLTSEQEIKIRQALRRALLELDEEMNEIGG